MTTGRINQVTISICATARRLWHSTTYSRLATLSLAGVRYKALLLPLRESPRNLGPRSNRSRTSRAKVNERNTLFPVLTSFRSALRVHSTRITTFNEDYQQPEHLKGARSHGVSPMIICVWFGHRQAIHILLHCRHTSQKDDTRQLNGHQQFIMLPI